MTPEQAQDIYHEAGRAEYIKHQRDYSPVNQKKVILAGFGAVIDAVANEIHTDYALKYLTINNDLENGRAN